MHRLLALVLFTPALAAAQPLTAKYVSAEAIHLANQGGAINRRHEVTITVDLLAGGKLRATDTGLRHEHNLYSTYSTDDDTTWTNRWVGTWKQQSARLVLALVLDHRDCKRVKTTDGTPPEQLACDPVDGKLALTCTSETIAVGDAPVTKLASWRCTPAGTAELADTPVPWTFGRTSCVRTLQGRSALHYERC